MVALAGLMIIALGVFLAGFMDIRPRAAGDAGAARIACLSWTPFHRSGDDPLDPATQVDPERIRDDLRRLSALTPCVRTYSVGQGLDAVPAIAQELGMQVLLGARLGRDEAKNAVELDRAITLAASHRQTVRGLIVGNEVLRRGELPPSALAAHLARARREAAVPVSYADTWDTWMQHGELARTTDFATVHILPWREDTPIAARRAVAHVLDLAARLRTTLDQPVLVGETGWPSAGRQRGPARPGRVNQARFVRDFVREAAAAGVDYNLTEAFDQPWKRRQEGAMGGSWGLLDRHGTPKFPWSGPVAENPRASRGLTAAALGAVLGLLLALAIRLGAMGSAGTALLLGTGAMLLVRQWDAMQVWNQGIVDWIASGAWTLVGAILCLLAAPRLGLRLDGRPMARLPAAARTLAPGIPAGRLLAIGRLLILGGATAAALMLAFDGRYRSFPLPLYLMPGVALALLAWLGDRPPAAAAEERVLALALGATAIAIAVAEGPANTQAMGWCALALLIAASCWPRPLPGRHAAPGTRSAAPAGRPQRRASTSSATTVAAEEGSAE